MADGDEPDEEQLTSEPAEPAVVEAMPEGEPAGRRAPAAAGATSRARGSSR